MKKVNAIIVFVVLTMCLLINACSPSKKTQASKAPIKKIKNSEVTKTDLPKKDTINNTVATTKVPPIEKTTSGNPKKESIEKRTPPLQLEKKFKLDYPTAKGAVWAKEPSSVSTSKNNYKVYFQLLENKNSIIYTEKGELIESKTQILPEQLPPNIHAAIKTKYPGIFIISAATIKNTKTKGAYIVLIRTEPLPEEKEIILTEDGTFIE